MPLKTNCIPFASYKEKRKCDSADKVPVKWCMAPSSGKLHTTQHFFSQAKQHNSYF